jgi:hypothetical protein
MRLYEQEISLELGPLEPRLIMEHQSIDYLKIEARQMAISLGCLDICWIGGVDSGSTFDLPLELEINEKLRLVIRDW